MLPPEVTHKQIISSVGVVNNFSRNNVVVVNDEAIIIPCNADTIKEQVAFAFADAESIDRVVILDSLLYHPDSTTSHLLLQNEVNELCQKLEVEMLYSIDYACITFNPASQFVARPLNAYLCAHVYTPNNDTSMGMSILDKETLEYWINSTEEISHLLAQIPKQLSVAATKSHIPTWKERERVFYHDCLCYELREAKVHVRENNWEAAADQWRVLLKSKWRPYRFMGHYNLALYYEISDDIDQAITHLDLAEEIAMTQAIDCLLVEEYREVLQNRKKELEQLKQYHQNTRK